MSSHGPHVEEAGLLTRIRRWIASFASGSFWPLHNEHPDVEMPPDDPVLPDYEDEEEVGLVWGDDADGLQEAEAEPQGGNGDGEQQVPSPYFGLGWRQGPAAPFPVYYPVYYPIPYLLPYAFPPADAYGPPNPFGNLEADPPADHYGFPADPFADPPADPYGRPPAFPPAYPFGDFQVDPDADPYGLPHAFPSVDPHGGFEADPDNVFIRVEYFVDRYGFWQHEEDEDHLEDNLEDWDVGDNGIEFPILDVEDIGPVCQYDAPEELSEADSDPGPSTRRRREDSDGEEEAAAKRPRWSDDSDSD